MRFHKVPGTVCALLILSSLPGHGQPQPRPAPEAAGVAFASRPEQERMAIQEALIWTGDYRGTVDGEFGRMTHEAMAAFAKRAGLRFAGDLDRAGLARLLMAGRHARDAARFRMTSDPRSGVTIGIPAGVFARQTATPSGVRYATVDGSATLDLFASAGGVDELSATYERLRTPGQDRRVTYRVLRADFFVVSGEAGGNAFYTRVGHGAVAGRELLRGYTLTYPTQRRAAFDIYSIAIASSFLPFVAATRPSTPDRSGTGIAIAPERVLTVLPGACRETVVASRKASLLQAAEPGGLALLDVPGLQVPAGDSAMFKPARQLEGPVLVLQFTPADRLETGQAPDGELVVAAGDVVAGTAAGGRRVRASLQPGATGAPVFLRQGGLAGLVGPEEPVGSAQTAPRLAGAVAAGRSRLLIEAAIPALTGRTESGAPAAASRSAGEMAVAVKDSIVPVLCRE